MSRRQEIQRQTIHLLRENSKYKLDFLFSKMNLASYTNTINHFEMRIISTTIFLFSF
jgi:hypothetical protein